MTIKNKAVKSLYFAIREGLKKGWPDEADAFSTIVLLYLDKWEKDNFPEKISFRFSELASELLTDAENAAAIHKCFRDKINIWIALTSNYTYVVDDSEFPRELKKVPNEDELGGEIEFGLFLGSRVAWGDKDGEATITINYEDELRERIIDEDLSNFKIELSTPYIYDGNELIEWFETGKTAYQINVDEPHKKIAVKYEERMSFA